MCRPGVGVLSGSGEWDAPPKSSGELDDEAILRNFGFEPDPVIEAYEQHVERSLLRQTLERTPEARWRNIEQLLKLAGELRQGWTEWPSCRRQPTRG